VGQIEVEVEPGAVGLDVDRLTRLDRHFDRYVEDGRLPGWLLVVTRGGRVAHLAMAGQRDREAGLPMTADTVFRIYSMTKPITSVAAMMLCEEGAFELKDPVGDYIESFRHQRVYRGGSALSPQTVPTIQPMRIWHLLTHTSGLTYAFHNASAVDAIYRAKGDAWVVPGIDLATACERWGSSPLLFQPGREWNYSVSTDVLGHLVEVVSGQSLDTFFAERIFAPLGMKDSAFSVESSSVERLAMLYAPGPDHSAVRAEALAQGALSPPTMLSGGAGLVSTAADYHRFTQMLRNRGELDGARLLGSRTVDYMVRNHLPGNADLESFGRPLFAETTYEGIGFGLGFSVVLDPVVNKVLSSKGTFAWGGAASTVFWVDPQEDLTAMFFTQLLPSSTYPIRSQLSTLVYQALVD
jgi:CubicO group peptidase (beta-lactamase class C family)